MLRAALTVGLLVAALSPAGCGEKQPQAPAPQASAAAPAPPVRPPSPPPAAAAGPEISFAGLRHDFGSIWDTGSHHWRFPFTNTGSETLEIQNVTRSCGCTSASVPEHEIAPGETSAVEVTLTPKGRGAQKIYVDVFTNARQGGHVRLAILADVRPLVTFEPGTIEFDHVALGQEHRRVVTITSPDPDLQIDAVETTATAGGPAGWGKAGSFMSAKLLGPAPGASSGPPPLARYEVEVRLWDDAPWGCSYGVLSISCRGHLEPGAEAVEHTATAYVLATVYGKLRASDTMFRIATVPVGAPFQRTVRLDCPSGERFTIVGMAVRESTMPGIRVAAVPIREPGASGYDLVLSGDPGGYTGLIRGVVAIETDMPREKSLELMYGGMIADANK